jgi:hypothetical protein
MPTIMKVPAPVAGYAMDTDGFPRVKREGADTILSLAFRMEGVAGG